MATVRLDGLRCIVSAAQRVTTGENSDWLNDHQLSLALDLKTKRGDRADPPAPVGRRIQLARAERPVLDDARHRRACAVPSYLLVSRLVS